MLLLSQTLCALTVSLFAHSVDCYAINHPTVAALQPRASPTNSTNTACAVASSASLSFVSAQPQATSVNIPAQDAYACLESVPNRPQPAIDLVESLRRWFAFQTTIEYLKDPPPGYLHEALDLYGQLDEIEQKVYNGAYASEYDFQIDILAIVNAAHDGHFYLGLDLSTQVFSFGRAIDLVAVSADGLGMPQIYAAVDLVQINDDGSRNATGGFTPSPIVQIDNQDVVSFLLAQSTVDTAQDPDANWNAVFLPIYAYGGIFSMPTYYPGPQTTLTFANGTSTSWDNYATVLGGLDGIQTGDDAYDAWCWTSYTAASSSAVASASSAYSTSIQLVASSTAAISTAAISTGILTSVGTATASIAPAPTVPGYPWPAIKHSADSISGYYLNDTDYNDVAVLRVADFEPQTSPEYDPQTYQLEFQMVEQKFLAACVQLGKKKLIIDLQGNPGGFIDSGTDFFAQLFPTKPPNSSSNMRATVGMDIIIEQASANVSSAETTSGTPGEVAAEVNWAPFAWQTVVTPEMTNFNSTGGFIGPVMLHGGNFTEYFQSNYTDINSSDYQGQGVIVTGTNNRTGFHQPFDPSNIVVLYDGVCHSTCTVVSEYLKSYAGVQFITVGGRPQTGAMQAVGGVKGTQVFGWDDVLYPAWQLFQAAPPSVLQQAEGTVWPNFTDIAWERSIGSSINGRNHFRIGDSSSTPLQFVYEAADCRLWYTQEMLYDPVFLWNRVAEVAFKDRSGTQMNSQWCVQGSTGQPTSISGGWQVGTLGPQTPPSYAKATLDGWPLNGTAVGPASDSAANPAALKSLKAACTQYQGNKWLVQVMCGALTG